MGKRRCLLLGVAAALACAFAPVPPPRTGTAEAVVNAYGLGANRVRQMMTRALPHLLQSRGAKGMACLKGETNPAAWLGKHLEVKEVAPGGPVRVRLGGCRPEEALALLTALVDNYDRDYGYARVAEAEQILVMRMAQGQIGGNVVVFRDNGRLERRLEGPAVLKRPRLVSTGKAR